MSALSKPERALCTIVECPLTLLIYTDASPYKYYEKGKGRYMLHPETKRLLERLLRMLMVRGEDYTFRYIRRRVLHNDLLYTIRHFFRMEG